MYNRVELRVGEQSFVTTRQTLEKESPFFAALFSEWWDRTDIDRHYSVDSDPTLFRDVLYYLRSGNYPLFFDHSSQSFDCARYAALLGEAQFYGIRKLEEWIKNKRYLAAIEIKHTTKLTEVRYPHPGMTHGLETIEADKKLQFLCIPRTRRVYVCPRAIGEHRGQPDRCGRQCRNARDSGTLDYEDEGFYDVVAIEKKCIFKPEVCLGVHVNAEDENKTVEELLGRVPLM